jgi:uncharacterized protein (DUF305 family)
MQISRSIITAGLITGALVLAGCSAGTGTSPATTTPSSSASAPVNDRFNDSDAAFAMGMVEHHKQAIDMVQLVLDKDGIDPRVTELAENIKDAQGPEIDVMNSWIEEWGVATDDMSHMDHGMSMSDDDMTALDEATGLDASKLFLTQMTVHHTGAIDMAQTELDAGENSDARMLAEQIIDTQTSEIDTMATLLAEL